MNWISSFILITSLATIAVSKPQGPAPCKDGDTWMDDCNHCHCSNGLAACTQMACIPNPNTQRQVRSPQVSGAACKDGDRWNDGCNECRCNNGIEFCTRKICPAEGEYLRPVRSTECDCDPFGSLRPICDEQGQCVCRPHYSGLKCDRCAPDYHQGPDGCQEECVPLTAWKKGHVVCTCSESGVETCEHELNRQRRETQTSLPSVSDVLADQVKRNLDCAEGTVWKTNCADCSCKDHGPFCKGIPGCKPGPINTPKTSCEEGERWKDECNDCWCEQNRAVCTRKGCEGYPHYQIQLPEGASEQQHVATKREVKKETCQDGERWNEGCNRCQCHGTIAACTKIACDEPFFLPSEDIKEQQEEHAKKTCNEGDRWKEDCNECWCDNNRPVCTRKGCLERRRPHDVTKRDTAKQTCKEGETWQDDCNDCWCDNGRPACTLMGCEQIPQHTATKRDTTQQTCKEGERWKEDCNDCWCDNNLKVCTRKGCEQSHQHTVTRRDTAQQSCTPGKVWIQMTDNDEGCAKFTCQADGSVTSVPHFTREMCPSHPEYIEDDDDQQQQQQQQQQQHITKRLLHIRTKRQASGCTPGKVWIQMTDNDEGCAKFTCQADGSVTSVPHFTREMCPSHPEYIEDDDDQQQQQQQQQKQHVTKREAGCEPGTSWKEFCNECSCSNDGTVYCTRALCEEEVASDRMKWLEEQQQQRATRNAGCKPGDTWMNDCNQCTCNDEGKASCSRLQCEKDHPEEIPWLLEQEQQQQQQVTKRETSCTPGKVWIQMTDNDEGCAKFTCQADGSVTSVPHFTREMCPSHPEYIEDDDDQHQQQQQQQQQHVTKREAGCKPGDTWMNDCNQCTCNDEGKASCSRMQCEKDHPEEIPWLLEQEQQQQQQVTKRETTAGCTPGKVWIQIKDNDEGCAKFTCQADGSITSVPHFTREMCPSHPEYIEDDDDQQQQQQQQQQQHVSKRELTTREV